MQPLQTLQQIRMVYGVQPACQTDRHPIVSCQVHASGVAADHLKYLRGD